MYTSRHARNARIKVSAGNLRRAPQFIQTRREFNTTGNKRCGDQTATNRRAVEGKEAREMTDKNKGIAGAPRQNGALAILLAAKINVLSVKIRVKRETKKSYGAFGVVTSPLCTSRPGRRSNKVPVSKLPEINRRKRKLQCTRQSVLAFSFPQKYSARPSYFLVERLSDYGEKHA